MPPSFFAPSSPAVVTASVSRLAALDALRVFARDVAVFRQSHGDGDAHASRAKKRGDRTNVEDLGIEPREFDQLVAEVVRRLDPASRSFWAELPVQTKAWIPSFSMIVRHVYKG